MNKMAEYINQPTIDAVQFENRHGRNSSNPNQHFWKISGGKFSSAGANKIAAQAYPKNAVKTGHVRHILTHCGTIASRETEKCQMAHKLADCTTTLSEKFKL